jgi:hypothetical protein
MVTGMQTGINFGCNSTVGDLPDNETGNTTANPWLELSMNVAFFTAPSGGGAGRQSPMVFG